MKKPIIIVELLLVAAIAIAGIAYVFRANAVSVTCSAAGTSHTVVIQGGVVKPATTKSVACDTLTITNNDPETRKIGFGKHEDHQPYDGVSEKVLRKGESLTIVLNKKGTFGFHDHYHHETAGQFIVK